MNMKERILNLQPIKNGLVRLGPKSYIVQLALRFHARRRGFQLTFSSSGIQIRRGGDCMLLNKLQFIQVPIMMECFDLFFDTIKAVSINGRRLLDFSQPALHEYTRKGVCFYFPSIPEDDVVDAYTRGYKPRPGDIVWDAGAHAGASTYFFSHLVGPSGRVFAFEPDDSNYEYLVRNVEMHKLTNVTLVKKALSSNTGVAKFNMDGTMSAGIHDFLVYSGTLCNMCGSLLNIGPRTLQISVLNVSAIWKRVRKSQLCTRIKWLLDCNIPAAP
jgi:hypothetical protein